MPLPSGLGPQCVGVRVVVRRLLPGQTGPTGGPAMTDLLGVMEEWTATTTTIRAEDGTRTVIALSDIVSGKPVPPRPSLRGRVAPEEAQLRAVASWPAVETSHVGQWLLRASGGYSARGNSALLVGDPGCPLPQALTEVRRFYADRGLPAWVQVVTGAPLQVDLERQGWQTAREGEADTLFLVAGVAAARRALRRLPPPAAAVVLEEDLTDRWLATDERAQQSPEAARAVLAGPPHVAFASALADGRVVARGRVARGEDDWAGLTALWVDPAHRRQGLGLAVAGELLAWAAEQGATTAYLQVLEDNRPARSLYERLGFSPHHAYRYLRPT